MRVVFLDALFFANKFQFGTFKQKLMQQNWTFKENLRIMLELPILDGQRMDHHPLSTVIHKHLEREMSFSLFTMES